MKVHCRHLDGACATRGRYKLLTVNRGFDFYNTFQMLCISKKKFNNNMSAASLYENVLTKP
jgi:hypothetical protein